MENVYFVVIVYVIDKEYKQPSIIEKIRVFPVACSRLYYGS